MCKYVCLSLLAGFLAIVSVNTQAQDSETIGDVRCVVVGIKIGGTSNAAQQSAGLLLTMYYIGRLDGRVPKLDFEGLLAKEAIKMTALEFKSEASRCGIHLTQKGEQITKIGKDMSELGQKMLDKANTPSN
jgi:hypothetical protein